MMRLACKQTDVSVLKPMLKGTCAVAIAFGDPAVPAKIIKKFSKTNEKLKVKAGSLGSRLIDPDQILALADLPPKKNFLPRCWERSMPCPPVLSRFSVEFRELLSVCWPLSSAREKNRLLLKKNRGGFQMSVTKEEVVDFIKGMTVLELSEFVKELKQTFGVSAAAPVAVAAMPGGAAEAAPVEEQNRILGRHHRRG